MKVKLLIEELQKQNPEAEVFLEIDDDNYDLDGVECNNPSDSTCPVVLF